MHGPLKDMTGAIIGRWTVLGRDYTTNTAAAYWICQCSCPKKTVKSINGQALRENRSQSCGCYLEEVRNLLHKTHGLSYHRVYRVWRAMWNRCTRKQDKSWHNYGGRGIVPCDRWKSLETFVADLGLPEPGQTLERRNNDLGYSPDNCYWASRVRQARNTRRTRRLTYNGVTKALCDWADEIGIASGTLLARVASGWSDTEVIEIPLGQKRKRQTLQA